MRLFKVEKYNSKNVRLLCRMKNLYHIYSIKVSGDEKNIRLNTEIRVEIPYGFFESAEFLKNRKRRKSKCETFKISIK